MLRSDHAKSRFLPLRGTFSCDRLFTPILASPSTRLFPFLLSVAEASRLGLLHPILLYHGFRHPSRVNPAESISSSLQATPSLPRLVRPLVFSHPLLYHNLQHYQQQQVNRSPLLLLELAPKFINEAEKAQYVIELRSSSKNSLNRCVLRWSSVSVAIKRSWPAALLMTLGARHSKTLGSGRQQGANSNA